MVVERFWKEKEKAESNAQYLQEGNKNELVVLKVRIEEPLYLMKCVHAEWVDWSRTDEFYEQKNIFKKGDIGYIVCGKTFIDNAIKESGITVIEKDLDSK